MAALSVINQSQLKVNQAANQGLVGQIAGYASSSIGIIRVLQVVQKSAKITNAVRKEIGAPLSLGAVVAEAQCANAISMMGIVALPGLTLSAIQSISDLKTPNSMPEEGIRKAIKAVGGTADALGGYGHAISMVVNNPILKKVVGVLGLTSDVADAALAVQDLEKSSTMLKQAALESAPEIVQTAILHSKRYAMLKTIKAILAIVGGILGVAGLVATGALAIALIVVSLVSVSFAIAAHFYKETRPHEMINFFERPVLPLATALA